MNVGEGAVSSQISGEAAGLEDLAVHDSGASLHVGQSRDLGLTPSFFSRHVASPGPRHQKHVACFVLPSPQRFLSLARRRQWLVT